MERSELTISQQRERYTRLKQIILEHKDAAFDFLTAAYEIRTFKLYKLEFDRWEDFCEKVIGYSKQHVDRLICAQIVRTQLEDAKPQEPEKPKTEPNVPKSDVSTCESSAEPVIFLSAEKIELNEGQCRALAVVPEAERPAVLEKVKATGKPVTAAAITDVAQGMGYIFDATGFKLSQHALPVWNRKAEAEDFVLLLLRARRILEKAQGTPLLTKDHPDYEPMDLLYAEVTFSDALASLSNCIAQVERSIPYALCPTCQGRDEIGCLQCKGRKVISKFAWDCQTGKDVKELRQKFAQRKEP